MIRLALAALWALAGAAAAQSADQDARALFLRGEGATAQLSSGMVSLPATAFPCANCHGRDAMGGREGTTRVPPIRWSDLAQATTLRPGYDADALARAVSEGVDPGARTLDQVMPRYRMPEQVLAALPAMLAAIEAEQQAGIGPDTLDLIAPTDARTAAGFRAALEDFDATGAAHGRKFRIVGADQPALHDFRDSRDLAGQVRRAEIAALLQAAIKAGEAALVPIGLEPADIGGEAPLALGPDGTGVLLAGQVDIMPDQRPIYARRNALGTQLVAALDKASGPPRLVVTDPFPAAAEWARTSHEGREAAWGYSLGQMAVEAAIIAGRATSHARFEAALNSVAARPIETRAVDTPADPSVGKK